MLGFVILCLFLVCVMAVFVFLCLGVGASGAGAFAIVQYFKDPAKFKREVKQWSDDWYDAKTQGMDNQGAMLYCQRKAMERADRRQAPPRRREGPERKPPVRTTLNGIALLLLFPACLNAGLITWDFSGPGWSGQATFKDSPPDFDGGNTRDYIQPIAPGHSFEATFGDYTIRETSTYIIETSTINSVGEASFGISAMSGSHTQVFHQGQLVDQGLFAWQLYMRHPGPLFGDPVLPAVYPEVRGTFANVISVPWQNMNLPTGPPPQFNEVTYIGGRDIDGSMIPEPSTWGLMILGAAVLGFYWRKRRTR